MRFHPTLLDGRGMMVTCSLRSDRRSPTEAGTTRAASVWPARHLVFSSFQWGRNYGEGTQVRISSEASEVGYGTRKRPGGYCLTHVTNYAVAGSSETIVLLQLLCELIGVSPQPVP
ncbi:hypothetical protein EVAR_23237_1 [Eumeta japonica]|uniref:Uncharacterized protein n=1 Tax=Eumeta variegata TaxID=151549 RepID=A0A4C1VG11_EUMVA|nr:hypothetical protein EVAR_23237_1 [Eumeta japonica]